MTRLALPGKCGFLGANGFAEPGVSACSNEARASDPRPTEESRRKVRRVRVWRYSKRGCITGLAEQARKGGGSPEGPTSILQDPDASIFFLDGHFGTFWDIRANRRPVHQL